MNVDDDDDGNQIRSNNYPIAEIEEKNKRTEKIESSTSLIVASRGEYEQLANYDLMSEAPNLNLLSS